jgi:hypothetical protein
VLPRRSFTRHSLILKGKMHFNSIIVALVCLAEAVCAAPPPPPAKNNRGPDGCAKAVGSIIPQK